ncbi:hypothetical protein [Actinopolymorpha pittospori]|uniref:Uncharacterized protein n=1 Tax=Actinopolymorpha pittospori TaxID=648752 RepID=A0A927MW53_9ACTN|nr:hypothetical protein [Actinopolymorpha pittospori]MBE1604375.1 hypothetical protein [Actinopolymorpha pittospori]
MSSVATTTARSDVRAQPGVVVTGIGVLTALWCAGFAVFNIAFEFTDHFESGPYADYAGGFAVMDWFVVALKIVGAAVALLAVAKRPRFVAPSKLAVVLWGAFATLALYVAGSLVEAVGMLTGLMGSADDIDAAGVAYVCLFLVAATGFGVLAVSYSRRHQVRRSRAVLGVLGAPALLGLILLAVPTLLAAFGLMPAL